MESMTMEQDSSTRRTKKLDTMEQNLLTEEQKL
jgi:hypothetical protein